MCMILGNVPGITNALATTDAAISNPISTPLMGVTFPCQVIVIVAMDLPLKWN